MKPVVYNNENPVHRLIQRTPDMRADYEQDIHSFAREHKLPLRPDRIPPNETLEHYHKELDVTTTTTIDYQRGLLSTFPAYFKTKDNAQAERAIEEISEILKKRLEQAPVEVQSFFRMKAELYKEAQECRKLMDATIAVSGETEEEFFTAFEKALPGLKEQEAKEAKQPEPKELGTFAYNLNIEHVVGKGYRLRIKARIHNEAFDAEDLQPSLESALLGALKSIGIVMNTAVKHGK